MTIVTGITSGPLDVPALIDRIRSPESGGLVVFEGSTRSPSEGKVVLRLEYEAYEERALAQLETLAKEAVVTFGVQGVVAMHRIGVVPAGEPSVVVAAAAEHRASAFEAARWLIDTLKADVSIWKKEIFEDGEAWA